MFIYLRLFAVFNLLNGVVMIVAPEFWYVQTPGASDTGPFNVHFVRDIGIAFFVAGLGLVLGVPRKNTPAADTAWISMMFIAGHALLHLYEMIAMDMSPAEMGRDFVLVVVPVLVAIYCLLKISGDDRKPNHRTMSE